MLQAIAHFFMGMWIWSLLGGIYHVPINSILLFLFLKLWDHLSLVRAALMSIGLSIGSFIIFFGCMALLSTWEGIGNYTPSAATYIFYTPFFVSMFLAGIYCLLQFFLIFVFTRWAILNKYRVAISILISNILAGLLMYKITQTF